MLEWRDTIYLTHLFTTQVYNTYWITNRCCFIYRFNITLSVLKQNTILKKNVLPKLVNWVFNNFRLGTHKSYYLRAVIVATIIAGTKTFSDGTADFTRVRYWKWTWGEEINIFEHMLCARCFRCLFHVILSEILFCNCIRSGNLIGLCFDIFFS